jgi:hypothetical protein
MDGYSTIEAREQKYEEILIMGLIICKSLNYKELMEKLLKQGTMLLT